MNNRKINDLLGSMDKKTLEQKASNENSGERTQPKEDNSGAEPLKEKAPMPDITSIISGLMDSDAASLNTQDVDMIFKIKKIMDKLNTNKDDSTLTLLHALKPYMNERRTEKLDNAIKMARLSQLGELFKEDF